MAETPLKLHGSIYFLLEKFVVNTWGEKVWEELNHKAGSGITSYSLHEHYPASLMDLLLNAASDKSGLTVHELKEKFGFYMVPALLDHYKEFIDPSWTTIDMIEKTESVMHKAARDRYHKANPPVLNVNRVSNKLLVIDYYSKRKMAGLAVGILKGIAFYYKEDDKIKITPVTNPDMERVQIRVEILKVKSFP